MKPDVWARLYLRMASWVNLCIHCGLGFENSAKMLWQNPDSMQYSALATQGLEDYNVASCASLAFQECQIPLKFGGKGNFLGLY